MTESVYPPAGGPAARLLTAAAAARIAALLNNLPVSPPGVYDCPIDRGPDFTIAFTHTRVPLVFTIDTSGCAFITVTAGGVTQPALSGGQRLLTALEALMQQKH